MGFWSDGRKMRRDEGGYIGINNDIQAVMQGLEVRYSYDEESIWSA